MGINKVVYKGETLVDLTDDTVTPDTLAYGVTAHAKDGEVITGTSIGGGGVPPEVIECVDDVKVLKEQINTKADKYFTQSDDFNYNDEITLNENYSGRTLCFNAGYSQFYGLSHESVFFSTDTGYVIKAYIIDGTITINFEKFEDQNVTPTLSEVIWRGIAGQNTTSSGIWEKTTYELPEDFGTITSLNGSFCYMMGPSYYFRVYKPVEINCEDNYKMIKSVQESKADKYIVPSDNFYQGTDINVGDNLDSCNIIFRVDSPPYDILSRETDLELVTFASGASIKYAAASETPAKLYFEYGDSITVLWENTNNDIYNTNNWKMSSHYIWNMDAVVTYVILDMYLANTIRKQGKIQVDCQYN
jgi:hypothetical protein